jgi:hypothetical protein
VGLDRVDARSAIVAKRPELRDAGTLQALACKSSECRSFPLQLCPAQSVGRPTSGSSSKRSWPNSTGAAFSA